MIKDRRKTKEQLLNELAEMRQRIAELEALEPKRKRAEEELRDSEEGFRDLYENAPNAYFSVGVDGVIRRCNRRAGELLGYAVEELVGRPVFDLYADTPREKEKASKVFQRFRAGETITDEELQMQKADGTPVWISLTVNAVRDARGQVVESRSMVVDITERKQAAEALRESEERYRSLFDGVPVGLYRTTPEGQILDANSALVQMLGYPDRESLLAVNVADLYVDSEDRSQEQTVLEQEGIVRDFEMQLRRFDGTVIWVRDSAQTVRDADGRELHYEGSLEDITERKRAEKELWESRELFEKAFVNQRDAILLLDVKLPPTILDCNPAARDVFGYTRPEMQGRTMTFLHVNETTLGEFQEHLRTAMKEWGFFHLPEFNMRRKDGTVFPAELSVAPLKDKQGQHIGWVSVVRDITERKQAEEALRKSEHEKVLILSSVSELVSYQDRELEIIWANRAAGESVGLSADELVGRHCYGIWQQRSEPCIGCPVMKVFQTGEPQEAQMTTPDGRVWSIKGYPVRGKNGDVVGAVEVTLEITKRKRAEEALKRRAAQLALINDISGKIATMELDSVLDRAARLVQESFGYHHVALFTLDRERSELVMRARAGDFARLFPPDHRLKLDQGIVGWVGRHGQTLLANDVDAEPHYVNLYPDVIPTRSELSVPIRVDKKVVGALDVQSPQLNAFDENDVMVMETLADQIAVAIENARLYQAAQRELAERKRVVEALRESEERYRRLVEFSPELIAVHSEGKIVYINAVGVKLLGAASPEELVGKPMMDFVHLDYQELIRERVRQSHEQGKAAPPVEERLIRTDGQVIDVETTTVPITYQGKPAMLVVARDINERKQLEAQLRQAQKMETLGSLAAGIAHDFNNLLTPISGFAALLLRKAPEGSRQQEYLRYIGVAAERAASLTRQLRLFTRQEEGERHPVQLNGVVEETHDLLERSLPKDITIELSLDPELWTVEADPSQISQVLMNLCVNARDAMSDGGTVTLETRNVTLDEEYARTVLEAQPGRYVCLSVSDSGCGMSPEVQARLFEPFFTTKGVGEGTGLGLAVVYGIVKGHGGFINVYSEEGQGSTFRIYLPAVELAVEEREVEGLELPTGTETILLVDDEEMVRALGQSVLERCGYTVLTAEDGVQALEVYQAHRGEIALVVLDVIMPQMGGLECLRRLRELNSKIKVLMSTGYMAKGLAQELVAEDALGVVERPFQLRDFATVVRTALDQS